MYVHEVYELEEGGEEELSPIQGLRPESSDVDSSLGEAGSQKDENSIVEGQPLKEEHQKPTVIYLTVIHKKIEGTWRKEINKAEAPRRTEHRIQSRLRTRAD